MGQCAKDTGCFSNFNYNANMTDAERAQRVAYEKADQKARHEINKAIHHLTKGLDQDIQTTMRSASDVIEKVGNKWANEVGRVLIQDMKCNEMCLKKASRLVRLNPAEL